jgi:hypothetical protein
MIAPGLVQVLIGGRTDLELPFLPLQLFLRQLEFRTKERPGPGTLSCGLPPVSLRLSWLWADCSCAAQRANLPLRLRRHWY